MEMPANGTTTPRVDRSAQESTASGGASESTLLPLSKIEQDLKKPVPERLLETKRMGGEDITFCPWYRVQKILDHYTGGFWEYEVRDKTITGSHLLLTVRIYIHAREGTFHREGTGIEELDVESYGDPQSNAESMAFRRAASRWGVGLDLYENN
jgi:hypothetical protein